MTESIHNLSDLLKGHINGPIVKQEVSRLTAPGENYGSLMLKVDITVKNKEKEEVIHAVAKCVPPNKVMQGIFNIPITFKNEIGWYTTVIPTLLEFQKNAGVKNVADFFMNIYGARLSLDPNSKEVDDDGVLLCENLATKGYKNADRRIGFNLEQSQEILKKLAAFHALSLALRLKSPEVFNLKVKQYLHVVQNGNDPSPALEPVIEFLKENPETSVLVPQVQEAFKYLGSKKETLEVREPWAAAIHTDFWVNNIMLKEEEGKPPKVIILDLQTCAYGSPVDDLLFFLGTSVRMDLIEKKFDELIRLYYIELMESLKSLNADTNLFPYGSFEKELELQGSWQFAHSVFLSGFIQANKEKRNDVTNKEFNPEEELISIFSNLNDNHKARYIYLTKEFAKRNWI